MVAVPACSPVEQSLPLEPSLLERITNRQAAPSLECLVDIFQNEPIFFLGKQLAGVTASAARSAFKQKLEF